MESKNMKIGLLVSLAAILVTGFIAISMQTANAQTVLQGYPSTGRTVGSTAAAMSKTINMHGLDELELVLAATGGNFNSTNLVIQASVNNANFLTVDTIALGTNTTVSKHYSDDSLGGTLAVNPAAFPYVKVTTSAGVGSVIETLTYSAR